jgi:hypothetical protein
MMAALLSRTKSSEDSRVLSGGFRESVVVVSNCWSGRKVSAYLRRGG